MAKHKKYDIALAKIENMDLVIFLKHKSLHLWSKSPNSYPPNNDNSEAFLCLPKHEEACLKALNGEDVNLRHADNPWIMVNIGEPWNKADWYMQEDLESKPMEHSI